MTKFNKLTNFNRPKVIEPGELLWFRRFVQEEYTGFCSLPQPCPPETLPAPAEHTKAFKDIEDIRNTSKRLKIFNVQRHFET